MKIVYVEPAEDGSERRVELSREEAISRQRAVALRVSNYDYATDQDALDDFTVVHWAWWEEGDVA